MLRPGKQDATSADDILSGFPWQKTFEFKKKSLKNVPYGLINSIGSDNGLAPKRRRAIVWTIVGMLYWRLYASLGLHELTETHLHI